MTVPKQWASGDLGNRIDADPESVERGLVQLVLTLVELLRQLMEKQAIRRVEVGARSRFIVTRHAPLVTVANLRRERTVVFDGEVFTPREDFDDDGL